MEVTVKKLGVRNFWLNFWLGCLSAFIVFFLFEKYKNVIYKSLAKPWFEFRWTHLTIFLRLRKNELAKVEISGKPMAKPSNCFFNVLSKMKKSFVASRSSFSKLSLREISKYGVFSGPYFAVFGLNTEIYCKSPYSVRM